MSKKDITEKDDVLLSNISMKPDEKTCSRRFLLQLKKIILVCISLILMTLGASMIIITAPSAEFEIATIYYFNPNDGITVTDLIALVIVLFGLYLLITVLSSD